MGGLDDETNWGRCQDESLAKKKCIDVVTLLHRLPEKRMKRDSTIRRNHKPVHPSS
jgi:hypothetical protein